MLLDEIINYGLLERCWKGVYSGKTLSTLKRSSGIDEVSLEKYEKNYEKNIKSLLQKLQKGHFSFNAVKGMIKVKDNGKRRLISILTIEDRIVHRAILSVINRFIYKHINTGVSYCGVKKDFWEKGKSKELNIKKAIQKLIFHIKKDNFWIFETDIQGFFDNVPKHRMICRIFKVLPDDSLKPLIRQIIKYEIGNPEYISKKNMPLPDSKLGIAQGSSLSPIFANLYLSRFDNAMKKKCGDRFIRYVDDFIVVCKTEEEAENIQKYVEKFLRKEGLELSPSKTHIINLKDNNKNIKFLGLRISRLAILPKKESFEIRNWLQAEILNLKKYEKSKKIDGNRMTYVEWVNGKIEGYVNFYKYYHTKEIFTALDTIIDHRKGKEPNLFCGVKKFNSIEREEIIAQKEWQSLFR